MHGAASQPALPTSAGQDLDYDVIVVGAGFAGLNALHNFRCRGLRTTVLEAGDGVGGTWYWNRYPGARVDVESLEYSYGFCDELQQEWHWPELYSAQPDVLRYLDWVADRLDLRKDVRLRSRVEHMRFDEDSATWTVGYRGEHGQGALRARYCVLATGFLSVPKLPDIPGIHDFAGPVLHTGAWPATPVDLTGRRVGVIGTAASGVQIVQELAPGVESLAVFQRTANWCLPIRNAPMSQDYETWVKRNYPEIRRLEHRTRGPGSVLIDGKVVVADRRKALEVSPEERLRDWEWRWRAGGVHMARSFADLVTDERANDLLREFLSAKIRGIVDDPALAERLIPDHPPLTRRPPGEAGYYEAFNRPNVSLVDIRSDPIRRVRPQGVGLSSGAVHPLDVLICATGFDSGSGAALRIDITGRAGASLAGHWADGVRTHLGLMVSGFPNLFFLNGPQSPGPHFSPPLLADYQSRFALRLLDTLSGRGLDTVEPRPAAEQAWGEHVNEVIGRTLIARTDSWWMGTEMPGKPRQAIAYAAGFVAYERYCEAAIDGLRDYLTTGSPSRRSA